MAIESASKATDIVLQEEVEVVVLHRFCSYMKTLFAIGDETEYQV